MTPQDVGAPRTGLARPVGASLLLHAIVFLLALWVSTAPRVLVEHEPAPEPRPTVQVTFAPPPVPKPREPPPARREGPPQLAATPPRARQMPPPPEPTSRETRSRIETSSLSAAAAERAPLGGAGGPLPEPSPGAPPARGVFEGSDSGNPPVLASHSLEAKLRDFQRSLGDKGLEAPRAPRGGGLALGGLDLRNLPQTGFGIGNLEFESRDYDWTDYGRQIYWIIWRAWHNRLYLTTDVFEGWASTNGWLLDHRSRIRFTLQASGDITDVFLETPSGCTPLDQSAIDALNEAVLPPLPKDFPRGQETIHARFIAEGDIQNLRATLVYLKRLGWF